MGSWRVELGPRTCPLRQPVRVHLLPRVPWIRRSLATGQGLFLFCSGSSQTIPDHQGPDSFPRAAGQITADPAEFQRPEIQNFCRWAEVTVSQGWAPTRGFRREPLPVSGGCLRCLPCVCITPVCKGFLLLEGLLETSVSSRVLEASLTVASEASLVTDPQRQRRHSHRAQLGCRASHQPVCGKPRGCRSKWARCGKPLRVPRQCSCGCRSSCSSEAINLGTKN
ncbi:uncharacterized protein LOC125085622 [Lutra lutra]|uniref:uncharacterized protein LOC125085622 n=1 Tax=Lutra lutra TaxID=9657 RepID=UPI001FD55C4C|nr:uncharacterized protein LOC125085622 [Lutra lutra]